ncbi:MAG TPA: class I SAM-dependent methyltransferase [Chloroflexia bacterium]|nr:class I SAM-dependent methyltransferase [Chloroflexia bacterium]
MSEPAVTKEVWSGGSTYEPYIGRWSRLVAHQFLTWLGVAPQALWLDVGCGTGALSQTIFQLVAPDWVTGIDRSDAFVAYASQQVRDKRAHFTTGDAQNLPFEASSFDCAVSGLVLNFVPQPDRAVAEMVRVTRRGGTVAAYVWDYAGRMQLMRYFWDAALALDSAALELDEGQRFPLCQPKPLTTLFREARLVEITVRSIDVPTIFRDFDDYWTPFLGGQAPAPRYAMSLPEEQRVALRERLRSILPFQADGTLSLIARAWAVKGTHSLP